MKLEKLKQQAIGKHLFVNGKDWGRIKGFDYGYDYRNSIIADHARINHFNTNALSNLLQGKPVKRRRRFDSDWWHDVYEIREEEETSNGEPDGRSIWSPRLSPMSSIWQHMSGLAIDEATRGKEILYTMKGISND